MILAQAAATTPSLPAGDQNYRYELAWLDALRDQPLWQGALALGLAVVLAWCCLHYWRERRALSAGLTGWLLLLRLVAVAGIVLMLLGPQRRSAQQFTRPSRVMVLVDSSLSMAMPNALGEPSQAPPLARMPSTGTPSSGTRMDAARELLASEEGLLHELAKTHVVSVATTSAVAGAKVYSSANQLAEPQPKTNPDKPSADAPLTDKTLEQFLQASSASTRLGDALLQTLDDLAGEPLAGIVLLTDGRNNAGAAPSDAAADAQRRGAKVLTIGMGPLRAGTNLVVRELVAPSKAYPNDELELSAVIDITGQPTGESTISLYRRLESQSEEDAALLETKTIQAPATQSATAQSAATGASEDAEPGALAVRFTTEPEQAGQYVYTVRASPLPRELRTDDNARSANIEIVDRVTHALVWAGGPGRDFRFLRNQLQRDDAFVMDVLLQSASESATQDARKLLREFPTSEKELDAYDVLVALDPDWSVLNESQTELIENWIAQRGGGLYFVPGPVNTLRWLQRDASTKITNLLPVTLPNRLASLSALDRNKPSTQPLPVRLTRSGADADFLWIAGTRQASDQAWRDFAGFYRVTPTLTLRAGATVYAEAKGATSGSPLVVFAEQFYGAGRVFYAGSNELWRLRSERPDYFSTLQTKILRRLAQGRLLSNSPGGSLLFERDRYQVGDTMTLRAILPNAPSAAGNGPSSTQQAELQPPTGQPLRVALEPSGSQRDTWVARLPAEQEGVYLATLLAGAAPLKARAEVQVPAAERDQPTRDAALLARVAQAGGGWYYPTAAAALNGVDATPSVAAAIASREETRIAYDKPDEPFARQLSQVLLGVICGALLLEWLSRRLSRLA